MSDRPGTSFYPSLVDHFWAKTVKLYLMLTLFFFMYAALFREYGGGDDDDANVDSHTRTRLRYVRPILISQS
jgi:hypothetical protein